MYTNIDDYGKHINDQKYHHRLMYMYSDVGWSVIAYAIGDSIAVVSWRL